MRKNILTAWIVFSILALTAGSFINSEIAIAEEEKKATPLELDGTQWNIELMVVEKGGNKEAGADVLVFEKKQFFSEGFRGKGYEPTNYTVSLEESGSTKFGTMQNKEGETIYWEGQIKDGNINGSVYLYSKKAKNKGVTKEYYFKGGLLSGNLKFKEPEKPVIDKPGIIKPEVPEPPVEAKEIILENMGDPQTSDSK